MADSGNGQSPVSPRARRPPNRGRPTFLTRTATDEAAQLLRRGSDPALSQTAPQSEAQTTQQNVSGDTYQPPTAELPSTRQGFASRVMNLLTDGADDDSKRPRSSVQAANGQTLAAQASLEAHIDVHDQHQISSSKKAGTKETPPAPSSAAPKLDTFSGVFVPVSLNVLSILMFIRFGFILGQSGLLGTLAMLVAAYIINTMTAMSISAVASNGVVRGGGAYYLISRSLGPEFGGAIGVISYMGYVFNTGLNAAGLVDCLIYNFGATSGNWSNTLPESGWWQYLWCSIVVAVCVTICLAGSEMFARVSNGLLLILLVATFSIPFSALVRSPFEDTKQYISFTGLNVQTLRGNLLPRFTKGAAGSQIKSHENFQDLFGILFPSTCGILAGASMSGSLQNPSKSIPRGTLSGMGLTFIAYSVVILSLAASITRESFYRNVNVVQDSNLSGSLILAGELATTFFSTLMGIIGPANQLQAIARDDVVPGLSFLSKGTTSADEPFRAIFITFAVAQLVLMLDINQIASLITMAFLMTFFALNAATFLLKIGSAPNFRPSFHYFNWGTALLGALLSVASMFFVDGFAASGSIVILLLLILIIHYTTPPKPWGSISEVLIYHQVRKYLLRLKTEHVKFWRPQILLFVNDPRRGYKLIQFCNSLKKGGLYILGHVIVTQNFSASVPEARKQQAAWTKYIDFSHIKAFVNVAISPSIEWGARNVLLSAGLGSMRPNLVIFGVYNLQQFRSEQPLVDVPSPPPERKQEGSTRRRRKSVGQPAGALPTDVCVIEKRTDVQSYVMVLEDMILSLKTNLAIAAGFNDLELPNAEGNTKKYIDLWPIQMSAEITEDAQNVKTTNFDTYTMILQLGCILNTVPSWKRAYRLRVAVFVEYESDLEEERSRVTSLLENLRIEATVLVFTLASDNLKSYQYIVNGTDVDAETESQVDKVLEDEAWWKELGHVRGKVKSGDISAADALSLADALSIADEVQWGSPGPRGSREASIVRMEGLRRILLRPRQRSSFGNLSNAGVSLSMRTSRIDDDMLSRHASHPSDSEWSESDDEESDGRYRDEETEEEDTEGISTASNSKKSPSTKSKSKTSSKKSSRASSRKSARKHRREASGDHKDDTTDNSQDLLIHFDEEVLSPTSERRGRLGHPRRPSIESTSPRTRPQTPEAPEQTPSESAILDSPDPSPPPNPNPTTTDATPGGPSIQFIDQPHPKRLPAAPSPAQPGLINKSSIYQRGPSDPSPPRLSQLPGQQQPLASGFPAHASIPLSFNTLPSRAQHLILNELIAQNSEDTAVILTTLPAPSEGTFRSEGDSLGYVSNLEVLYGGLPPCLLVHSNSMTVTTNL